MAGRITARSVDLWLRLRRELLDALRAQPISEWPASTMAFCSSMAGAGVDDSTGMFVFLRVLEEDLIDLASNRSGVSADVCRRWLPEFAEPLSVPCLLDAFWRCVSCALVGNVAAGRPTCVDRVKRLIEQRYPDHLTLSVVADTVGRERSYLATTFRRETGKTIHGYLTSVRVRHAAELIRRGVKIEAVTLMVGYRSKKTLYHQIHSRFGKTPAALRDRRAQTRVS